MGENTGIQWTEATWNPIRGCSRVSPGCMNCYAEKEAKRFSGPNHPYAGLLDAKGRWNGVIAKVPRHYEDPMRWQRPRMIFVNSMSDLFHENLEFEFIAGVFGIMAAASHHVFQVLTKRPERMVEFFQWLDARSDLSEQSGMDHRLFWCFHHARHTLGVEIYSRQDPKPSMVRRNIPPETLWPLPNVWLGTSVENQKTAETRIPLLEKIPAAVRWISMEPLLGPVDLTSIPGAYEWLVVGGESGDGARICQTQWIRDVLRDSKSPVFVKQMGKVSDIPLKHKKGADPDEWPEDLRVRDYPISNA